MDKSNCSGCRDNFYNSMNNLGVDECWSLPSAKMKTRYSITSNVPMTKANCHKVKVPKCYTKKGMGYLTKEQYMRLK